MKRKNARWMIAAVALAAIVALVAWKYWPDNTGATNGRKPEGNGGDATSKAADKGGGTAGGTGKAGGDGMTRPEALEAYNSGLAMLKEGKLIEARSEFSKAFFSGKLTNAQEEALVPLMTDLAEKTLLSGNFYDGDMYVMKVPGDSLSKLVRNYELRVPWRLLEKINGLRPGQIIRADQTITVIQGPMHAIIDKSDFTLDVYLQRDDRPKVFVKRFPVGLGSGSTETPTGSWYVTPGKKLVKATWHSPENSLVKGIIPYGRPGYPLGKKGYWISLTGSDPKTRGIQGIGIHGTNDPGSVGKAQSLGCIRMLDEDIEWVFAMLYDKWSTVTIKP